MVVVAVVVVVVALSSCRTPVWLKTAFAVLVQEGGGIGARLVRGKGK